MHKMENESNSPMLPKPAGCQNSCVKEDNVRADKVLKEMLEREHISTIEASKMMGRSKGYVSNLISRHTIPRADTMAAICDAMGYDLIARSREDGYEFHIDPSE